MLSRRVEPFRRGSEIFVDALIASIVRQAEIVLPHTVALFGRFARPLHSLREIFRHALATKIARAEHALGRCKALLSSFAIPLHGFGEIFLHAIALVIAKTELVFGTRVASFCFGFYVLKARRCGRRKIDVRRWCGWREESKGQERSGRGHRGRGRRTARRRSSA